MIRTVYSRTTVCNSARKMQTRSLLTSTTARSKQAEPKEESQDQKSSRSVESQKAKPPKKTLAQLDEEMRAAMDGLSGDGGIAGAELEGGKAVSMKRGVRDNMFRYI